MTSFFKSSGFYKSFIIIAIILCFSITFSGSLFCDTEPVTVKREADPGKGYSWPYFLCFDKKVQPLTEYYIIVLPNNSGEVSDDYQVHLKDAERTCAKFGMKLTDNFTNPFIVLTSAFPRYKTEAGGWRVYTHALDRDSMMIAEKPMIAVTLGWASETGEKENMNFDLDGIFIIQDNIPYRCVAADFNPAEKFKDINSIEITFIFPDGIDMDRPFNLVEYPHTAGFFIKDISLKNQSHSQRSVNSPHFTVKKIFKAYDRNFTKLWSPKGEEFRIFDTKELQRLDNQLCAMIEDAGKYLADEYKLKVDSKVMMFGFSASGMFVDRFTYLHPDVVKAAAIGSPGGMPMVPLEKLEGKNLPYPIGLYDYKEITGKEFDRESFARVKRLLFLGDKDENDSVIYRDSFDKEDETLIMDLFGKKPLERFYKIKDIFEQMNLNNTEFRVFPELDHKITNDIFYTVSDFFLSIIGSSI